MQTTADMVFAETTCLPYTYVTGKYCVSREKSFNSFYNSQSKET